MRIGLFFFVIICLSLSGCWRDGSNQDFFIGGGEAVVCTVTFDFLAVTLPDATEGVAYADTTSLVSVTTGGSLPYTYTGTFSVASNLFVEADGDIVSGTGGAGVVGVYSTTVTVFDATGVCNDTITVSITINPSTPVEICDNSIDDDGDTFVDCLDTDCATDPFCVVTAPRIDPAGTVDHMNGGGGGTDSVSGSALSGSNTVPDFIGVQSNANATSADRIFVIDIDSDGVGLDATTVIEANVTVTDLSTGVPLTPVTDYSVTYAAGPPETITVNIFGGSTGISLAEGATHLITITTGVTNTLGDPFTSLATANSIRFLTVPDWVSLVFDGLSSAGATCVDCHDGSISGGVSGGIAFTNGGTITLDFTGTAATAYTSLLVADSGNASRTYLSLNNGVVGFSANNPNSAIIVNKLSATGVTPSFGTKMPLFSPGSLDDATVTTLTGGPTDPDTAATITDARFMLQLRSWVRGGAPDVAE